MIGTGRQRNVFVGGHLCILEYGTILYDMAVGSSEIVVWQLDSVF